MRRHLARGLSRARTAVVRGRIQASNRRANSGTGIVAGIGRTLTTADSPAFALAAIRCAALVGAILYPAAPRKIGQVFGLRGSAVVGPANDVGRAIRAKIPADGLLFTRPIGLADRPFDRFTQPAAFAAVRRAAVAGAIVYPAARRRTGRLRRLRSTAKVGLANNVGPAIRARIPADGGFFMRSIGLANQPIDRFAQPAKKGSVIAILLCAHAAPNAELRRWAPTHIGSSSSLRNLPKKFPLSWFEPGSAGLPSPHPPQRSRSAVSRVT